MYDNLKSLLAGLSADSGIQLPPGWDATRVMGYAAWKRTVYDSGMFGERIRSAGYQSMFDEMEKLFEHFLTPIGGVSCAAMYVEQVYYPLLLASQPPASE